MKICKNEEFAFGQNRMKTVLNELQEHLLISEYFINPITYILNKHFIKKSNILLEVLKKKS